MAKEPASIRFKNPGAMWGSPLARKWGAEKVAVKLNDGTGQGNNIAVFPTYVHGICAQLDLWRTSKHYRNKAFKDAIRVWSGGNHVESYIKFVLARVPGMTRNTVMDDEFWLSPMGIAFLKAQAWHEAGKPYPAPDADWIEARRRVFRGVAKADIPPPPDIEKPEPKPDRPPFYKRWWTWVTGSGVLGTVTVGGLTINADIIYAFCALVAVGSVAFLAWVYLVPPRGRIRKGVCP